VATPFLVPNVSGAPGALTRPRINPVDVYLARLGPGSRRGMLQALDAIADFISTGALDANERDWTSIRYRHTSAVRGWLVQRYAPNTANRMMAALRGILKEVWRLGFGCIVLSVRMVATIERVGSLELFLFEMKSDQRSYLKGTSSGHPFLWVTFLVT